MSVDRKKYSVAEFYDDLQVIPSCWIQKDNVNCLWPTHLTSKSSIDRAVIRQYMPQEGAEWPTLKIVKIFGESAEDTSTLQDSDDNLNSTIAMIGARKSRQKRHK
ncbi:hypothetical protein PV326_011233 [Microctonus aethiopoides]|nr:hypothetical protein PV326_011233 [Microctonus aethiopoides]